MKVFGSGWHDATGEADEDRYGIICFITVAGFLTGPGFQKMREDLRRDCSDIWVIDCSPEGHQPDVPTRIFQGVQQPICIVLAARSPNKSRSVPSQLRYLALPKGKREKKFEILSQLSLESSDWRMGAAGWRESFLPEKSDIWTNFPSLADLFVWSGPGVKAHRTWVISPDSQSLGRRWDMLRKETNWETKEYLFHADRDRSISKIVKVDLGTHKVRPITVAKDQGPVVEPCKYGFRSFDRQWIVPDHRLLSMARPELWSSYSARQIYLTALESHSPSTGPAVTFTNLIPDNDHYRGSFAGRVFPLWRDAGATQSNIHPELLTHLAEIYGEAVSAEDVMAYIAAVMAHPAFAVRFAADLVQPGLRLPFTADKDLFAEALALGRQIVWLHSYGERFADPKADRPKQAPRLPKEQAPKIPADGAIPAAPEPLPETMEYDPAKQRLKIGKGYIENVTPRMWAYDVSGVEVLKRWFSYRRRDRSRPIIGDRRPPSPLGNIQPDHWLAEYTTDLLDLLHVLGRLVALENTQADLLDRICAKSLLSADHLRGLWAVVASETPKTDKAVPKRKK